MVIDTSAVMAILSGEPEQHAFNATIEEAATRLLSAATLVELSIVVESRAGAAGVRELDDFIAKAEIEVVTVDLHHALEARRAFARFGKGRDRAGLNFGDCFAYALASVRHEPLLFKGSDFGATDLIPAV